MDYDILLKIGTLIVGVIGAAKLIYDSLIGKKNRMREEYKFAKEFMGQLQDSPPMHPYLREKGYQAIAGDNQITANEIEYLLSLERPERALRDFVLGRSYLEHLPNSGSLEINFSNKYEKTLPRALRKYFYLACYFILAFLAFSPFVFSKWLFVSPSQMFSALALTVTVLGPYAWFSLRASTKIYRAEKLVRHQNKHTQRFIISK